MRFKGSSKTYNNVLMSLRLQLYKNTNANIIL
jgi:hypothetical protein